MGGNRLVGVPLKLSRDGNDAMGQEHLAVGDRMRQLKMYVLATSATFSMSLPPATARLMVSPVWRDSLSIAGCTDATRSKLRSASVPSRMTSRPSRYRLPYRASSPARSSAAARRDAVDLCTPIDLAISVTPSSVLVSSKLVSRARTRSAD